VEGVDLATLLRNLIIYQEFAAVPEKPHFLFGPFKGVAGDAKDKYLWPQV